MEYILKLLAESVLIPLGLTAAESATDAAIQKKVFGSVMTILIVSNEEMNDIMNPLKTLGYWYKALVKEQKMKQNNKKVDFSVCY